MGNLSVGGINAIIWTLNAIAIILTAGRLYLRGKVIKRFDWDDLVHCFALAFQIIQSSVYSGNKALARSIMVWETGKTQSLPDFKKFLQLNVLGVVVFFSCIWSVKLAFMLLYGRIFKISSTFMKAWWIVLVFTFLTFWVCIGTSLAQCDGRASDLLNLEVCNSKSSTILDFKIFKINFAMNISSDVAIMILPLAMLPSLKMRWSQKFAVAAVFSLSLVVVAFEILRTVESLKGSGTTLNVLWDNLETSIAVIVSCLPSYNSIFAYRRNKASYAASEYNRLAESKLKNKTASSKSLTAALADDVSQEIPMESLHDV